MPAPQAHSFSSSHPPSRGVYVPHNQHHQTPAAGMAGTDDVDNELLDLPPTPEDFAHNVNIAKNTALDALVEALAHRTSGGVPTREALPTPTSTLPRHARVDPVNP